MSDKMMVFRKTNAHAVIIPTHPCPDIGSRSSGRWPSIAKKEDRQFGVVNIQPAFSTGGSGLEASRK